MAGSSMPVEEATADLVEGVTTEADGEESSTAEVVNGVAVEEANAQEAEEGDDVEVVEQAADDVEFSAPKPRISTAAWTSDEQASLEAAILEFRDEADVKQRWKLISQRVDGRSARECAERFRCCRDLAMGKIESLDVAAVVVDDANTEELKEASERELSTEADPHALSFAAKQGLFGALSPRKSSGDFSPRKKLKSSCGESARRCW